MKTPPIVKISRGKYKLGPYEIWKENWHTWRVWDCDSNTPIPQEGFSTLRDAAKETRKQLAIGDIE